MIIDPEKVAGVIVEIAEEEIAPRFGKLAAGDVDTKSGPNDFVTEADLAAERQLEKALSAFYPAAAFIGEERAAADPKLVSALEKDDGAFWIVDPLDGTRNFVQGREEFGTIVALIVNGETRGGWIYAIPDKNIAMAEKGEGATWRGDRLRPLAPKEGPLQGGRAIGNLQEPWRSRLVPRMKEAFQTSPVGCSAYGYIRLVTGEWDFGLYARVHPWDHAAGIAMLKEIGGQAQYLDTGDDYAPRAVQGRPLLVAGSVDRWEQVSSTLLGEAES